MAIEFANADVTANKSEEPINYPAGNLLAHFKRCIPSHQKGKLCQSQ